MKKSSVIIICVIALIAIIIIGGYNGMVSKQEKVESELSNLDTQLQRRADLIPNLVNTVKGHTKYDTENINKITYARTKLVNASSIEEKSKANDELTSSLNALLAVVENYPELKASQSFKQLLDGLEGTENRIAVARRDYNNAVRILNTTIRKFPNNLLAGVFGIEQAVYFEADEASSEVPNVSFE